MGDEKFFIGGDMVKLTICMIGLTGFLAADELPTLKKNPWKDWFVVNEGRYFDFGVNEDGVGVVIPLEDREDQVSEKYWIELEPVVQEILPNGHTVTKQVQDDGWHTETKPTDEFEKVTYRATVTGGAQYEVHFAVDGGEVYASGRLVERGELTEHPVQFSIQVHIPNVYAYRKDDELARRDRLNLELADGGSLKFAGLDKVDAEKQDLGGGITEAKIRLRGFDRSRIDIEAGEAGFFDFLNDFERELYKGYTLKWTPKPDAKPDATTPFILKFR